MTRSAPDTTTCPCCSSRAYAACCAPLHVGLSASDAEALMRSRYAAYVLKLEDYLLQTWHPETRPATLDLAEDMSMKWMGLEIKRFETTGKDSAIVEFVARYKANGKAGKLHEVSRFVEVAGKWYYVDGQFPDELGLND